MRPADPRDRALDPRFRDYDLSPLERLDRRVAVLEKAVSQLEATVAQSQYVHLEDCLVKALSPKAALIELTDAGGEVHEEWFPLSQIACGDDLQKGGPQTVSVTEWIAKQKGIES